MTQKIGVLLVALGTPSNCHLSEVKAFLNEFLMDPDVIDIPWLARSLLVKGIIVPFRSPKTLAAYQSIWQPEGSPLLLHTQALQQKLQRALGDAYEVKIGCRYGQPSLKQACIDLSCEQFKQVIVLMQYPQYAQSSTGTALKVIEPYQQSHWRIVEDFPVSPDYIKALSLSIPTEQSSKTSEPWHWLLSFHGLPVRHLKSMGCQNLCAKDATPCPTSPGKTRCYKQDCYATARALAQQMKWQLTDYTVSFQSRVGKAAWIQPYTLAILQSLRDKGITHLSVLCPGFTVDCLETLEEIDEGLKAQWYSLGGTHWQRVSCLNANDHWVEALKAQVKI